MKKMKLTRLACALLLLAIAPSGVSADATLVPFCTGGKIDYRAANWPGENENNNPEAGCHGPCLNSREKQMVRLRLAKRRS